MPLAKFADVELFFESKGAGKPLILIPGFASGAWTWFRQVEELSKILRVVTFDPRGIGKSKSPSAGEREVLSMRTFVDDVVKLLDALELEKASVLGASFGGFVAQAFALVFPERLDKLILACTSFGGANHVRPADEILQAFAPAPNLSVGEKIRKFIRPAFTAEFNAKHPEEVEKVCRLREQNAVSDAVYTAQLEAAFSFDTENKLSAVRHETLVITGDKDNVVPARNSVNLAEKLPNATVKIIENGSHLAFIENAAEFNRAVREFLR